MCHVKKIKSSKREGDSVFAKDFVISKQYDKNTLERLHQVQMEILKDFIAVCEKYSLPYFAIYGTAIGAVRHQGFIPWDDDIDVGMFREDYVKFCSLFQKELGDKYNLLTPEIDKRYACTVTHVQKKGTKFVSYMSQDLKCEQCIFMDIFPFDCVAKDKKESVKQGRETNFLGRLLFLSGTPYPYIPYEGIKREIAGLLCHIAHYGCKLLRLSPDKIYKKYVKVATKYNEYGSSEYVTSFEYAGGLKDKIKKKEIFPLKKVKFEDAEINIPANNHVFLKKVYGDYMKLPDEKNRVNHMPYILDFGDGVNIVEDRNK